MDSFLSSLPADILLEIVGFLSLQDAVALSMTCHKLWSLSQEHAFWIKTLDATRLLRPLPCPLYEDFAKLDLPALKGLVRHAMRLEQNWSQERPQILAPIQSFSVGDEGDIKILFNIPGTPFIVTHTKKKGGSVTCWSRTRGKALCSVVTGGIIQYKSKIHQEHGKCSIAVRVVWDDPDSDVLMVLRVQYGPGRAEVSMKVIFRYDLRLGPGPWTMGTYPLKASLDSDIVVVMSVITEMNILAFNMASGKAVTIETDLPDIWAYVDIQIFDRTIYLHFTDILRGFGYFYCCPTQFLPYPDNIAASSRGEIRCHGTTEPYKYSGQEELWPVCDNMSVLPSGLSGTLLANLVAELPDRKTTRFIYFSMPNSVESQTIPPNSIRSCTVYEKVKRGLLVATPWSSACFVSQAEGLDEMLKLVRFHPDTESVSVHSLEQIPPYIGSLEDFLEMALDDHLGVVMVLSRAEGTLFSIPYA